MSQNVFYFVPSDPFFPEVSAVIKRFAKVPTRIYEKRLNNLVSKGDWNVLYFLNQGAVNATISFIKRVYNMIQTPQFGSVTNFTSLSNKYLNEG